MELSKNNCIHHWAIDNTGKGLCRRCGEERQFSLVISPEDFKKQTIRQIFLPGKGK